VGVYAEQVLPRVIDKVMDVKPLREARARACGALAGEVLEVGFGSGLNLPHLPPAVTKVLAVEPSEVARRLARKRIADAAADVELVGLDGQSVPLADDSADAALVTWTLCTIPDARAALDEVRRVLRPGGVLHFVEHGCSPDDRVRRWQHRLDGIQQRVAGGCHLVRDIPAMLADAGYEVERLQTYYGRGEPKTHGWTFEGVARPV
jgi:ubiquinone/menaquinone biosynthesis C-methylase UbiE